MKSLLFKVFLIAVVLVTGSSKVFGQLNKQSVLSIGIKQGVNLSQIGFDPVVDQDIYLKNTGGIVIKYLSEKRAGIQAEFNYSLRGWKELPENNNKYRRNLTYFEMPVLTHFMFARGNTKAIINVGPNLSYHLGDEEIYEITDTTNLPLYYYRKLDKDFELGLVGGLGIMQITPIGDFQLEFRFHYGLQNIFSTDITTNLAKSQNILIGASLTYFFIKKDFRASKN